jgi:nucleotide-binding universal stress UspA family protein
MTRILVPTDYSSNSRAGIRFAVQLALQNKNVSITFFHHTQMLRNKKLTAMFEQMMDEKLEKLKKFISKTLADSKLKANRYDFAVSTGSNTADSIINYAEQGSYDLVSISTRGESVMKKMLGSNTAALLKVAKIPVIAVPSTYRTKPIAEIMYVTDFKAVDTEIDLLYKLTKLTKANLLVWHATSVSKPIDMETVETIMKPHKKTLKPKIILATSNLMVPLEEQVNKAIQKAKPQLVVMFSRERKGFWERLLLPSKSEALASDPKVPMIVMKLG